MKNSIFILVLSFFLIGETLCVDKDTICGKVVSINNPCTTDPCLPGGVIALQTDSVAYILTLNQAWNIDSFSVDDEYINIDDSIKVIGSLNVQTDLNDKTYIELEIEEVFFFDTTTIGNKSRHKIFAPIGATWHYSKIENFAREEGYVKVVSRSDTIIEGKQSKILSQTYYRSSGDITIRDDLYMHQKGDTIYFWIDNEFRIVYDFSLVMNDTMEIYSNEIFCPKEDNHFGKIQVDSVEHVAINGISLKKIYNSPTQGSLYRYQGSFLEVIGGINGITPIDNSNCIYDFRPEIGDLRCYSDSLIGFYQVSGSRPCDTLIRLPDSKGSVQIEKSEIEIVYHAYSKSVVVELSDFDYSEGISFRIFDIMGRNILKGNLEGVSNSIDLTAYENGIYLIQIFRNNSVVYNDKFYKY